MKPTRLMFICQCLNQFHMTGGPRANERNPAHQLNLTKYSQEVTVSKGWKNIASRSHTLPLNSTHAGFSQRASLLNQRHTRRWRCQARTSFNWVTDNVPSDRHNGGPPLLQCITEQNWVALVDFCTVFHWEMITFSNNASDYCIETLNSKILLCCGQDSLLKEILNLSGNIRGEKMQKKKKRNSFTCIVLRWRQWYYRHLYTWTNWMTRNH